ncbi:general odorant-binding protein 83a-like [Anoplophora glabripennis]|uniref:Odorant binding protein 12 n=1 Tax=Anoplophora glabripennis TaxID=217634 RepID=A0A1W5XGK3_ANOGL|nr:general odorant-binding protein 83a-like [Anoplophora glabripennis]ARH65467.1 odorant binding protein 12 [Anoplophora glabripennis]
MSSRSIIFFFCLITLAYSKLQLPPDLQEYADELHDLCIKRTGITEDDHIAYDIANNPHDEKLQCYIKCLLMEANWMDKDGVIQYDWIEENIHEGVKDIVLAALRKCKNINEGANLCEKSSHFNACMYDADKENWFLV